MKKISSCKRSQKSIFLVLGLAKRAIDILKRKFNGLRKRVGNFCKSEYLHEKSY